MMTIRMGSTRRRRGAALAAAVVATAVGIGGRTWPGGEEGPPPPPPPAAPPTTAPARAPQPDPCPAEPAATAPPPPTLVAALQQGLAAPGLRSVTVGVSMWVDGYGEVLDAGADLPLAPASVQKVFTAMGALSLFEADDAFTTAVRAAGPVSGGVLRGDLVLVGGGDPTLTARGPHSLDALAAQVHQAGITAVAGSVVADESRYDAARAAPGWQDWQQPAHVGPMSALMVDDNRRRSDSAYLAAPATGNAEAFRAALAPRGVAVSGPVVPGAAPADATAVASLRSRPVPELVTDMLQRSDNETAELLAREAGVEAGAAGTIQAGTAAITAALAPLCVPLHGVADDGSGLSRADRRTAREWRRLLQAAPAQPWGAAFRDSLPVAGRSGTLAGRFRGTPAEGNVRAKTGTIIGGRSLAGYLTTAGGRAAVFAIVVNGEGWRAAQPAIDRLVVTLAADPS